MIRFTGGNVPVYKAAAVMNKRPQFVRCGMQTGKLPIGTCIESGTLPDGRARYTYYITPKLLYEFTGALVEGYYEIVGEEDSNEALEGKIEYGQDEKKN